MGNTLLRAKGFGQSLPDLKVNLLVYCNLLVYRTRN